MMAGDAIAGQPGLSASEELLSAASDPATTPFDYIVVGSGAGGGPLAARLALEGRRVLVIEAGVDPATGRAMQDPEAAPIGANATREVYAVPAYNGAATESPEISWAFSVRHYADAARQELDRKYCSAKDPSVATKGAARGGIFYPRTSALGGCTAHHAMIMVRPNDSDWDRIAQSTGDASWRSENMEGYFAKLEDCLYFKIYRGFLGRLRWLFALIDPRAQLEPGGHGSTGWQKTSFIHPALILNIVKRDRTFLRVLWGVLCAALADKYERARIKRALAHFAIVQFLDPNVRSPDFPKRTSHLSLIPIGTDGEARCGLREHLLDVARSCPERLVLTTGLHATRVLFESEAPGQSAIPRVIGVEVADGAHLYAASPLHLPPGSPPPMAQYFARREVILCGGTFNTPQLLMLSGIGAAAHLQKMGIAGPRDRHGRRVAEVIDLPGVGANLQDRYEVSVISKTTQDFSVLKTATFRPGDPDDQVRQQWLSSKTGLYTTNGGALAMLVSSEANDRPSGEPDLFCFGVPAAFRGYYWGWSKDLLHETIGASAEQRNLWTWLILKAYTHNNRGTVRLLSNDPFATPEIIFNSFQDGPGNAADIAALCDGVRKIRALNRYIKPFAAEIQPGAELATGCPELEQWVQNEAWGHHACGTCRIGSDPWRASVTELADREAVLDSRFRVHGVRGLRVVDASVFPHIPGYFLVSSVFMVGEKAADTLLQDSTAYPGALERVEAAAVDARRTAAGLQQGGAPAPTELPEHSVGLALSGGGIRSATFCLGVLQALASLGRLRDIDFLSSVSGGGYSGGFVGRLFTRLQQEAGDKVAKVQAILANTASPEIWWLRKNADYLASAGHVDVETNLAILARNLGAVHFFVAGLLFVVFAALRRFADLLGGLVSLPMWTLWGTTISFWWWTPLAALCLAVLPLAVGYWLTPAAGRSYPLKALLLWVALLAVAVYGLSVPGAARWSAAAIGVLLFAWIAQAITRSVANSAAAVEEADAVPNALVRNLLTRALGIALLAFAACVLWVVLDTLARLAAGPNTMLASLWAMLGSAPLLVLLRMAAVAGLQSAQRAQAAPWVRQSIIATVTFGLSAILIFFVDVLAHLAFNASVLLGTWSLIGALIGSLIIGRWFIFLNLSSLQQAYGQKLIRSFLGASNDARVHPSGTDAPLPVEIPSADDDISFDAYHPECSGGPLHLINTCVNDTVEGNSGRQLREDKGLPMCAGPAGLSVGRRYHALWQGRSDRPYADASVVRPLPVAPDPNAFHVLARSDNRNPEVERLDLGQWISISGAAVTTGVGRYTSIAQSLLLGLLNVRLGYWWHSGIGAGQRPGRYPPDPWRRLKSLPAVIFRMQATLLNEWRAYFPGPAERLWYLSDGGHFDNTGLYELFRRRLPFIIAVDAGEDPQYEFDDLAILTRQVRLDFGAQINWLDPTRLRGQGRFGWDPFDQAPSSPTVPEWIRSFIDPAGVGALTELRRDSQYCSALAHVTYADNPSRETWLLLLKANLAPPLPIDVRNYADRHLAFPNESTVEQFFKDAQWESYRALGQAAGAMVFRQGSAPAFAPPSESPCPDRFIEVRRLSCWDTLRVQLLVSMPAMLLGLVTGNRFFLRWFSRHGAGRPTMRLLSELRQRYACDHFWLWFPMRRTLLVLAQPTMDVVLRSDATAADPWLKKRALSRFVPDALVISSGDAWRDRRHFNQQVLDLGHPPRHRDAFMQIVGGEVTACSRHDQELGWAEFQRLGERISQQVILGPGRIDPDAAAQLARLVRCSNFLAQDTVSFCDFYAQIDFHLAERNRPGARDCLMGDSGAMLELRGATGATQVPFQIGFWLFVLKDALELHVARTLALIAAHPCVAARVRSEIQAAGTLTAGAIDGLAYLEACIREQLRLWTPVPLLLRRAVRSFSLREQIPIEATQQILMHVGFYHRDERVFGASANRFSPDMALGSAFPATYFFSGGRQSCAGRSLALFVLKATLASLLSRLNFELIGPAIDPEFIPYLYDHFSVRLRC